MARQNNYYRVHSIENLTATTSSGATRSGGCPDQVTKVRIATTSTTSNTFVKIGPGANPTATTSNGVLIPAGESSIFTVVKDDEIAVILVSGSSPCTLNITWLQG